MRVCWNCLTNPPMDQRPQAKDGRCYGCAGIGKRRRPHADETPEPLYQSLVPETTFRHREMR